ncbi:hemolysin family protein [Pygmaiobacter massiliensis]|uniref:hemolysin family protein n=1 Tax=Pygmaiobacter massiliensis TaxID=1917873 RepID=UPI000C7E7A49|nr:hemolysin family protein [Pygmaiobacter massiliensis]MDY4785739.1 hemolysin family protein [Pygmaiobacter massiliensis]
MDTVPSLLLLVVLIGVNAFFAMSEIAIISVNTQKMKHLAEEGSRAATHLLSITEAPSDFLATIQVGVTLSGFLASAVAADNFAGIFVTWLSFLPVSPDVVRSVVLVVITLVLSYFTLILGELVPKRIAMKDPDAVALKTVGTVWGMYKICRPFVKFLAFSTNMVLRLFGIGPENGEDKVGEEEILMMVEAGEDSGAVEPHERVMIENIFEFDDRRVSDVMTHRTDIVAVSEDDDLGTLVRLAETERFSRLPVYRTDLDDIVGTIYLKDAVPYLSDKASLGSKVSTLMREVLYVPSSMRCSLLLRQFRERRLRMAIVVDEYGGTEGLVTMEDLLEAIVGDLDDEHDEEDDSIVPLSETSWLFSGEAEIEDVEDLLGKDLFANDDSDTLNGFITAMLGRIPSAGEVIPLQSDAYLCTIVSANARCIEKLRIEKVVPAPEKTAD